MREAERWSPHGGESAIEAGAPWRSRRVSVGVSDSAPPQENVRRLRDSHMSRDDQTTNDMEQDLLPSCADVPSKPCPCDML